MIISRRKSNLVGRMPVQIKGKESNDFSKDSITFSMKTVDLRNYLKDSGCVLFVVYIGNNGLVSKIYYAELSPIKLRALLEDTKDKENKTVKLKEFPTENKEKEKILKTCKNFCEWIFEAPNEEIDDQVKILNELQIIKRTRNFSPNEIEKLYKMIENSKM